MVVKRRRSQLERWRMWPRGSVQMVQRVEQEENELYHDELFYVHSLCYSDGGVGDPVQWLVYH